MANSQEHKLFRIEPWVEDTSTETEDTNHQERKLFQPWVEDMSSETAEDTNHQERKLFQPWVKDKSTETVEDTVEDDVLLLSEKNETHLDKNSYTENEKLKDPCNLPSKAKCSRKEQQMNTKIVSSLSEHTETEKSIFEDISCKQSTSSHNYCDKNVECQILETCSSPSKLNMSSVATTTEYATCISSTYKINKESNISRLPLNETRTLNKIRIPDADLNTDASNCDIRCEKFVNEECLIKHVRTRTGEKPECVVCSKKFKRNRYLNVHMRYHTGQRTHQCTICNKTFVQKIHLTTHMSIHTGLKHHQCEVCYKKFARKWDLKRHMLTHTGQKPHPCTECDKRFSQKSTLKTHMRTHSNEKPYKCPE